MKDLKEAEVLSLVQKDVNALKGSATAKDLAARIGIPIDTAQSGLERMMELFNCGVSVRSETGDILFRFDYPLRKRGSKTFKETMHEVGAWLFRAITIVYRASVGVVLLAYFLVFMLITFIIALLSSSDNDGENLVSSLIGSMFQALIDGAFGNSDSDFFFDRSNDDTYMGDAGGGDNTSRKPTKKQQKEKKKPGFGSKFIKSVFAFVFGPDRPNFGSRDQAREVAAFIQRNNGKLTSGQLIALTGWKYDKAEHALADYLVKFKGHPELEESGTVIGHFIRLEDGKADDSAILYYKDEIEGKITVTGNSGWLNAVIIFMNIFNFFAAGIVTLLVDINPLLDAYPVFGSIPLIYSLLFFVIPICRIPFVRRAERQRQRENVRRKLIGVIMAVEGEGVTEEWIITSAQLSKKESRLARKVLSELVIELQGDISLDDEGKPLYTFQRLWTELAVKA